MIEQIKEVTLRDYGEPHWKSLEQQINFIEQKYINMYKIVRCPTWPSCPEIGAVIPYIDYYSLLNKLLWDLNHPYN